MSRLRDMVIVVMGAGSSAPGWSNGSASAVAYAREGARVVCVDFDGGRATATADLIRAENGMAVAARADATSEPDVRNVIQEALASWGRLDVLHNNVGMGQTSGTPDEIEPAAWEREIAQNLTSAYLGIRHAFPVMREQGGGVITNVSSLLAVRFLRQPSVAYTAGKAAVEAMTRSCAAAYGAAGVRVNCVRIGFSESAALVDAVDRRDVSADAKAEAMARSRAKVPLRREHGDPFDVAAAATFLASNEAKHITGAILSVDGGLECAPI